MCVSIPLRWDIISSQTIFPWSINHPSITTNVSISVLLPIISIFMWLPCLYCSVPPPMLITSTTHLWHRHHLKTVKPRSTRTLCHRTPRSHRHFCRTLAHFCICLCYDDNSIFVTTPTCLTLPYYLSSYMVWTPPSYLYHPITPSSIWRPSSSCIYNTSSPTTTISIVLSYMSPTIPIII